MAAPPTSIPFARLFAGSVLLLGSILAFSACGTTGSTQQGPTTPTLRLTPIDSTTGQPLDSARALNRTFGDRLEADSADGFMIRDVQPALHVFDIDAYGYHSKRHKSVLVEPGDTSISVETPLLPHRLSLNCESRRPYFWDQFTRQFEEDSSRVRIRLTDVLARDGEVRIQPILVNDLSPPIFLPENMGALDHYEVRLYDENNYQIPFSYENEPDDDGYRLYAEEDILPVVSGGTKRLEPITVTVPDSIEKGRTLYARVDYTFSTDDTLEATSVTGFPDLDLDSLQRPVFDTLRTDGEVRVPDSLVLQRDTTMMRVVGVDTIVTRNDYTLYSTLRDGNAASNAEAARNLLYVPDSVKARARQDSLDAIAEADTSLPTIDTTSVSRDRPSSRLNFVSRSDSSRLAALLSDSGLVDALMAGMPDPGVTSDSLLSISDPFREAYVQTPSLSQSRVRRGLNTEPDSVQQDSLILSAPPGDSLFQMFVPEDSLRNRDTTRTLAQANPFVPTDPSDRFAPEADSLPLDSLRLTVGPKTDSVVVDSVVTSYLDDPPSSTYWYVSASDTDLGERVMVLDSTFFRLRARPRVDTSASIDIDRLLPDRVGRRQQLALREYPQQVIRAPRGTYRSAYLDRWKALQQQNFQQHYCEIFPFPLRSEWRSASMY